LKTRHAAIQDAIFTTYGQGDIGRSYAIADAAIDALGEAGYAIVASSRADLRTLGRCAVGRLLDSLGEDERDALQAVLDDPGWGNQPLQNRLRIEGHHDVNKDSIRTHRLGTCACRAREGATS
jgi:hypothetical protein